MADRLGRHAILLHALALSRLGHPREQIVHDHFETFVGSQDRGLGVGTAVGSRSWFLYDLDPAPHRGPGRRREAAPTAVDRSRAPASYVASILRTFGILLERSGGARRLSIVVDGRPDYLAALRLLPDPERVALKIHPNPVRGPRGSPRSARARERDRALFPCDQLHQLIRHTGADHKRETLAFGRRLESIVGRLHLFAVWRNFVKGRSERRPDRTTPAMRLGLSQAPWSWDRVLARRLFPARLTVSPAGRRIYLREWTPGAPTFRRHHAF